MVDALPDISGLTATQSLGEKAIQGKLSWDDVNARNGLDLLGCLSLASGPLGVVGTAVDATISGVRVGEESAKEQALLGVNLEHEAGRSRIAREMLNERDAKVTDAIGKAAVSGAVGLGAGAAALALAGPVGWLAAAAIGIGATVAGSIGGSKAYDALLKTETKDTQALLAKIAFAQSQGVAVPVEAVGAALLSTIPEAERKAIENQLERKTGTRSFHQALQDGEYQAIRDLMVEYDTYIRTQTDVKPDSKNAMMTVAEQLTPVINSGQLQAGALIFDKDNLPILYAMQNAEALKLQQPGVLVDSAFTGGHSATGNFVPFPGDHHAERNWAATVEPLKR